MARDARLTLPEYRGEFADRKFGAGAQCQQAQARRLRRRPQTCQQILHQGPPGLNKQHISISLYHRQGRLRPQSETGQRRQSDNAGMGIDSAQNNALPINRLCPRVRLSSGGAGRDPNPEFPPRNPISNRLRLSVSRSDYRKKGWRVAQPKDPPALVWLFVMARWLSPRLTSRLDQP